jgi:hypothetical protein
MENILLQAIVADSHFLMVLCVFDIKISPEIREPNRNFSLVLVASQSLFRKSQFGMIAQKVFDHISFYGFIQRENGHIHLRTF